MMSTSTVSCRGLVCWASAVMFRVSTFLEGILESMCFLAASSAMEHSCSICSLVRSGRPRFSTFSPNVCLGV